MNTSKGRGQQTMAHGSNLDAPIFVNKVLLEHNHAHSSPYCNSCLCSTTAELNRLYKPQNQKYLQKKFADPKLIDLIDPKLRSTE